MIEWPILVIEVVEAHSLIRFLSKACWLRKGCGGLWEPEAGPIATTFSLAQGGIKWHGLPNVSGPEAPTE